MSSVSSSIDCGRGFVALVAADNAITDDEHRELTRRVVQMVRSAAA